MSLVCQAAVRFSKMRVPVTENRKKPSSLELPQVFDTKRNDVMPKSKQQQVDQSSYLCQHHLVNRRYSHHLALAFHPMKRFSKCGLRIGKDFSELMLFEQKKCRKIVSALDSRFTTASSKPSIQQSMLLM